MFVSLVIQQYTSMRHIVIWACPAVQNSSTFCSKRQDIGRKVIEYKIVFLFSVQRLNETFLILRELSEI
jgi:hypothetical protein